MRLPEVANDWAGCHQGRASNALDPPPPPAVAVYGEGEAVSFHAPDEAIVLSAASVRLVPPTARTHGDDAGQSTCGFVSEELSWLADTPRAHADDPLSPAATTVVMPSAAVAVSWRSTSVRVAVYGCTMDSHTP